MKRCTKCKELKPADLDHFYKHTASPSGLTPRCKPCVNEDNVASHAVRKQRDPERIRLQGNARSKRHYYKDIERSRAEQREINARRRSDPVKRAKINMAKRGGSARLTIEEFEALFASQGGVCAICETDDPGSKIGWNIDHCHKTKAVRFILCAGCNRGLGAFRDNPAFMRKAADLIEEFQNDPIRAINSEKVRRTDADVVSISRARKMRGEIVRSVDVRVRHQAG